MPIATSTYWNEVHGFTKEDVINAYKEYEETIEKRVEERVSKAIENLGKIGISVRPILFSEGNKN